MLNWFSQVSPFELFALITGLAAVILLIRQNLWTWPIGVLYASVSVWVFGQDGLYGQTLLHLFYVGMNLYGWWYWTRGGLAGDTTSDTTSDKASGTEAMGVPVTELGGRGLLTAIVIGGTGTAILGYLLRAIGDAEFALPDALVTSFSFVAMYLQARKYLQNWVFWFFINIASVALYVAAELYFYAALYVVYLGLAIAGYMQWRKSISMS